jgi:hypothetical protein
MSLVAKAIAKQNFERWVKCPLTAVTIFKTVGVCRECGTVARDAFL